MTTTLFDMPRAAEIGTGTLAVVTNGIPSSSLAVAVKRLEISAPARCRSVLYSFASPREDCGRLITVSASSPEL